jgi:hypothetical protein
MKTHQVRFNADGEPRSKVGVLVGDTDASVCIWDGDRFCDTPRIPRAVLALALRHLADAVEGKPNVSARYRWIRKLPPLLSAWLARGSRT